MALLKKARNQTAYLKAGIQGFAGSGKTFTASSIAIGLANGVGDGKPVAFFDTETGSDYVIPLFEDAGIELLVAKTRAFADLMQFMREAQAQCSVAIIDSISHVWTELLDAYRRKKHLRDKIPFHHWGPIKEEWRQFTDLYLNSPMHVILCGRAGFEYDLEEDNEGNKELVKTGTKMKAETEMGYEPSLLLEMWRIKKSAVAKDPDVRGWIHRCVVLKDRTNQMNGEEIDNPTFGSFRPILSRLNIGGEHLALDTSRTSDALIDDPDQSAYQRKRQVEIALEEIKECFVLAGVHGTSKDDKAAQTEALRRGFGTSSWAAITDMRLEELRGGLAKLRAHFGQADPTESVDPIQREVEEQDSLIPDLQKSIDQVQARKNGGASRGKYFAAIKTVCPDWTDADRKRWQVLHDLPESTKDFTDEHYGRAMELLKHGITSLDEGATAAASKDGLGL